jgi:hypothetical protein
MKRKRGGKIQTLFSEVRQLFASPVLADFSQSWQLDNIFCQIRIVGSIEFPFLGSLSMGCETHVVAF